MIDNMKIWVIEGGWDYEGFEILGIYSSKDVAIEKAKSANQGYDGINIIEMEIDNPCFQGENIIIK